MREGDGGRNDLRQLIISEIRRLGSENNGQPPGVSAFTNATGITMGKWRGTYWARWSDALAEAGYQPNSLVARRDSNEVLRKVAELCRILGRMPTNSDMRLHVRADASFPNDKTVASHFGSMSQLRAALRQLSSQAEFAYLADIVPEEVAEQRNLTSNATADGWVYLLRSGAFHKIGRSDQLERRVKSINIALPEAATLVHAIQTDDPSGIEAYWHRRFADRRANGEWFKLDPSDVRAFTRRKFQ